MTYVHPYTPSSSSGVAKSKYLDWGAVIAGVIFATAISVVLLAFGSGLGLAFTSLSTKSYAVGAGIGAALWFIWVEVSSFMAGGYLAGRLRRSFTSASEHEIEVRDGSHGLLVWAGCVVLGAYLALSGAGSLINSAGNVVKATGEVTAAASKEAAPLAMQYYADTLLRPGVQTSAPEAGADRVQLTTEISTILGRSTLSSPTDEDKTYLAQLVAKKAGVPQDEAKSRVDKTYAALEKAKSDIAQAAETARRITVVGAFLMAASLLVSAAAAFWAASMGGRHRDHSVEFTGFFNRV